IKASGDVVFICTDKGLSTTDGNNWITYTKNATNGNGKAVLLNDAKTTQVNMSPSISHNYTIGVDVDGEEIWVATSKGVSRGELLKQPLQ
ncbi:MAG: hypothetical protein WBM98_13105, partial [Maribacter sp.]|uniref:hypothetical protein n=1 Tax=Maribacter sp. TaxID=1897614 RepID=UPI003C7707A3